MAFSMKGIFDWSVLGDIWVAKYMEFSSALFLEALSWSFWASLFMNGLVRGLLYVSDIRILVYYCRFIGL